MDAEPTFLFSTATGGLVPATLHRNLTLDQVIAAEAAWKPHRRLAPGQHAHWDWVLKFGMYNTRGVRFAGVECGGEWQGLMQFSEYSQLARLAPDVGLPLVYVDYLEAAPWNVRDLAITPRFRGGGLTLVKYAVRTSLQLGASGRIGLHSLAQSVGFYEHGCGLTPLGPDPGYNGMAYFELSTSDVQTLLARG